MTDDFERVMAAAFAHFVASAQIDFTADAVAGSATLSNVSDVADLFIGLPVFGPGIPPGAAIFAIDVDAATIVLTAEVTEDQSAADFVTGFLTTGRRVQHWQQVTAQPAFFFRRTGTTDEHGDNFMPVRTLECEAWIYSQSGADPNAVPDIALSGLDRLFRASFAPDCDDEDPRFTIGGLVYWCRIEGRSDYSPGDQGPQGISRIPVRITLP